MRIHNVAIPQYMEVCVSCRKKGDARGDEFVNAHLHGGVA
jgi:hypothetical protein